MEPLVINIHLSSTLTTYPIGRRIFDLHSGSDLYRVPIFQLLLGTYRKYPFPNAVLVIPFLFSYLTFLPRWSFPSPHFFSNGQNTPQLLFLYTDELLLRIHNWQVLSASLEHCCSQYDTAIANIIAVSLNFWLIKLVKEQSLIFCNSKFTGCVILKEHLIFTHHFLCQLRCW